MEVLLDTNFIISCVKRNIDFISDLENLGFKVVVPVKVMQEMKDLRKNVKHDERIAIDLGMDLIERKKVKKIGLGEWNVDEALIKKGKEGVYIATIDRAIRKIVPNKVIISDSKNSIEIERE